MLEPLPRSQSRCSADIARNVALSTVGKPLGGTGGRCVAGARGGGGAGVAALGVGGAGVAELGVGGAAVGVGAAVL